ncbi:PTS system, cellobiose-specific IIB component [Klebsiella aerogenes]|nr:PTS system, cellobiose-specific IIB component [Klebsiella aerogenes]
MYKIMLCCSAGMSTSLLVRKMVEAANERDLPVQIDAYGVSEFDMPVSGSIRWCCLAPR